MVAWKLWRIAIRHKKRFNQTQIHFQYSYMSAAYVHVKDIPFKVSLLVVYFLLSFEPSVILTYWTFLSEVHFCFHYALAHSKMSRKRTHQQKAIFAHRRQMCIVLESVHHNFLFLDCLLLMNILPWRGHSVTTLCVLVCPH